MRTTVANRADEKKCYRRYKTLFSRLQELLVLTLLSNPQALIFTRSQKHDTRKYLVFLPLPHQMEDTKLVVSPNISRQWILTKQLIARKLVKWDSHTVSSFLIQRNTSYGKSFFQLFHVGMGSPACPFSICCTPLLHFPKFKSVSMLSLYAEFKTAELIIV